MPSNFYQIKEISPDFFWVKEKDFVYFYVFKKDDRALFIDAGLGINEKEIQKLFSSLKIKAFDLWLTHAHLDHVGLAYLADRVCITEKEWNRYLNYSTEDYIKAYYYFLREKPPQEPDHSIPAYRNHWQPSRFYQAGEKLSFGDWKFEVIATPGHSAGSISFYEERTNSLFLGDVTYDGHAYLHLKDSSWEDFKETLQTLDRWIKEVNPTLYTCHGTSPMDQSYFEALKNIVPLIDSGKLKPIGNWKPDVSFGQAKIFVKGKAKVMIKKF